MKCKGGCRFHAAQMICFFRCCAQWIKFPAMFRLKKILWLWLLLLGGGQLFAASSAEKRDFKVAADAFRLSSWAYAETHFDQFIQKYPGSDLIGEAVLFQAESRFHLRHYDSAIALLSTHQAKAGWWQDQYAYWIGEAQLAGGKFAEAAESFARLAEKFPVSTNRFSGCVREAEARARLQQWPQVIDLLQKGDGVFQQAVKAGVTGEFASAGYLILGEAQLAQKDMASADASLEWLVKQDLNPISTWRRSYLKCRVQLAEGQVQAALPTADELVAQAAVTGDSTFLSQSIALQADILERLGRLDEAIAAHKKNVASGMPPERQRISMLKIADLNMKQNKITEAAQALESFLIQHTNSADSDMALLTLGKLRLSQFAEDAQATNRLAEAEECFDKLLRGFSDSPMAGKAWLDKGWCSWLRGNYAEGREAFQTAAGRLSFSKDQAVARFKWADTQFKLNDFAGALTNYVFLVENFSALPEVKEELLEPALYQTVRAALEARDLDAATNALEKILTWYSLSLDGGSCLLLAGQGFSREKNPARARELFARFQEMYPTNALSFEVRLAQARSYERENEWHAAITNYDAWLGSFTNHPEQPSVEFSRAWDYFRAGRETNAFELLTNFVAQFPVHPLALQAQWWIGDYFFRQGRFIEAEGNYQLVFRSTNWPPSELTYQAQMMAGRAALARLSYKDAVDYFSKLAVNTNCPAALQFQATFACGDALMSRTDTDATNRQADLKEAIEWFGSIAQKYPTNELAPPAWGRMGDCYKDLAAYATNHFYELAMNAYQQVLNLPQASVAARSQARVGLGIVAEGQAQKKAGVEHEALLEQALTDYLDVFLGKDLNPGEQRDLYWVRESGLKAFRIASEDLNDWPQALNICTNVVETFPQLRSVFENKMLKAREHFPNGNK